MSSTNRCAGWDWGIGLERERALLFDATMKRNVAGS